MPMPSHLQLVEVRDLADFSNVVARKVCKSRRAADAWGAMRSQELAEAAHAKGEDIISFDYSVCAIPYLDN